MNADSLQIYKYMNIGTAKPEIKKWKNKIDLYLFDHITPPEIYTAGRFEKEASQILQKKLFDKIGIAAGGSGFYLQTLEKGSYPISVMSPQIKKTLINEEKKWGIKHLYEELKKKDPVYAKKIHVNDRYRILRAVALFRSEGKCMSEVKEQFAPRKTPYTLIKVGLSGSYEVLKKRVNERVLKMIQEGFIEEVQSLIDKGFSDFPALQSVGYKEILDYLRNPSEVSQEVLAESIVHRTMKMIKKQKSWFKRDAAIEWYDLSEDYDRILSDVLKNLDQKNQTRN